VESRRLDVDGGGVSSDCLDSRRDAHGHKQTCREPLMPEYRGKPRMLPVEWLRIPPPVPQGMNYARLGGMVDALRDPNCHLQPIEVVYLDERDYMIADGRHRWMANVIAGRFEVLTEEVEDKRGQA
jgi:hypothetical protein